MVVISTAYVCGLIFSYILSMSQQRLALMLHKEKGC